MTSHVVLGLGGCVDYELKLSSPVLNRLVGEYRIHHAELTSSVTVTTERELVISILSYLDKGGGGEHFVASSECLSAFAGRFPKRTTLGGTSVRAAMEMSRLGVPSTLHLVSLNDIVRRLLPADCDYICSGDQDTLYPHLIVQYDQGMRVRAGDIDIRAPFPNRLIYVNDPANESMLLSDELGSSLRDARVFLISGFNAVRDRRTLDLRLSALRDHMRRLPAEVVVYYEDAGFHEPGLSQRVRDALVEVIDIYGLNEDELQAHLGHAVDLLSVAEVARALESLRALISVPTLVVHTKYWSAAFGERAGEYAESLNEGIVIASTRYCHGDAYTNHHDELMRNRQRRTESVEFAAALESRMGGAVRCLPGFDLDVAAPTTVGLGDAFVGGFLAALAQGGSGGRRGT
ncbi:ADP-dependent phosphofructokinase/glucokinase [Nonomuraea solani]|uniref:ADP-dependent phosphofructokinase/glucokinase n=1 Tax=Nonomuraea solani TaxID=1144553 RepID=A0A1H5YLA6_9ACTN|nr:ADP-dependent glucokinase/phosphofructokinase [Nonomuraea solani]SEG24923.1 ADP-dependent phosphofructokinase/glucokinase [Nonomuraea solani]